MIGAALLVDGGGHSAERLFERGEVGAADFLALMTASSKAVAPNDPANSAPAVMPAATVATLSSASPRPVPSSASAFGITSAHGFAVPGALPIAPLPQLMLARARPH